ncbi:MAG: hypothetical protein QOK44_1879 [Betaproteobacteria bacterium]|jgi:hypothetical protein|nr:hypothetical protein [Betaproteobacteria bacterium]
MWARCIGSEVELIRRSSYDCGAGKCVRLVDAAAC